MSLSFSSSMATSPIIVLVALRARAFLRWWMTTEAVKRRRCGTSTIVVARIARQGISNQRKRVEGSGEK